MTLPPPPLPPKKKRGPKGICASGVCTAKGVIPLAQYLAAAAPPLGRALPTLSNKVGMTTPMPIPMGGVFDTTYKPADMDGPCDMCAKKRRRVEDDAAAAAAAAEEEALSSPRRPSSSSSAAAPPSPPYHVLRVTGRGCLPVGHGVYCSAECAQTAVFRHPAYRHWDDTDRFVAYQTMLRNPRQPFAYACALFQDSIYHAGHRTTTEVPQSRFRVQRASEQLLVARKNPRQELLADFFKFTPEKVAALMHPTGAAADEEGAAADEEGAAAAAAAEGHHQYHR